LPCLALPCLSLPCLALPCLAKRSHKCRKLIGLAHDRAKAKANKAKRKSYLDVIRIHGKRQQYILFGYGITIIHYSF